MHRAQRNDHKSWRLTNWRLRPLGWAVSGGGPHHYTLRGWSGRPASQWPAPPRNSFPCCGGSSPGGDHSLIRLHRVCGVPWVVQARHPSRSDARPSRRLGQRVPAKTLTATLRGCFRGIAPLRASSPRDRWGWGWRITLPEPQPGSGKPRRDLPLGETGSITVGWRGECPVLRSSGLRCGRRQRSFGRHRSPRPTRRPPPPREEAARSALREKPASHIPPSLVGWRLR